MRSIPYIAAFVSLVAAPLAMADDSGNPFSQELNKRHEGLDACSDFHAKYATEMSIGEAYNQSANLDRNVRLGLARAFDEAIGALRAAEKNVRAHIAGRDAQWTRAIDSISAGNERIRDAKTALIPMTHIERNMKLWDELFRVGLRLDGVLHRAIIAACAEVFPR